MKILLLFANLNKVLRKFDIINADKKNLTKRRLHVFDKILKYAYTSKKR